MGIQLSLKCQDCGIHYDEMGVDLVLPDQEWKEIFPEESGILCANCICHRARVHKGTAVLAWIANLEYGSNPKPATKAEPLFTDEMNAAARELAWSIKEKNDITWELDALYESEGTDENVSDDEYEDRMGYLDEKLEEANERLQRRLKTCTEVGLFGGNR